MNIKNQLSADQMEFNFDFRPWEIAFDRLLDQIVAWLERHVVAPVLGAGQSAEDF